MRLRTYPPTEPLGGLVKIDLKHQEEELSVESIERVDQISAEVYSLRSPSLILGPAGLPSFIPLEQQK